MNKEELLKHWHNRWSWFLTYAEKAHHEGDEELMERYFSLADQVLNCINELKKSAV